MAKQTKITKSAKGEECQVRIGGICNFKSETTVFAHYGGGGMGGKSPDLHGAYCCSNCHDLVDGRTKSAYCFDEVQRWMLEGILRTQTILLNKGLVKIFL
jgi:hypothetical protein